MPDVPVINTSERRINEAVCIDSKRIYDSCISKDCLEDLRVTFFEDAQTLIDNAVTVKPRSCEVVSVSIDVDEVPFNRGYYSVDITYYFEIDFDTYDAPCTTPQVAVGFTAFEKKCILFGSEGNVKIFTSSVETDNRECPEAPQYTSPVAKVQAVDPVVLQSETMNVGDTTIPLITSFPQSILDSVPSPVIPADAEKAVLTTLGLFSVVQMERDAQMMMPAYDYCVPEKECSCSTQDPCSTFRGIDFPVDEFFPPDKENNNCPCDNNNR